MRVIEVKMERLVSIEVEARNREEYDAVCKEGYDACFSGVPVEQNPYAPGWERVVWFIGWRGGARALQMSDIKLAA